MRAVICRGAGDESVLAIADVPRPRLEAGTVRIRVAAAGVNRADILQRRGLYPPPPGTTEVLGLECAGVVLETAPDVVQWHPGDRVMALLAGGGQAEEVVAHAGCLLPVSDALSWVEAAAFPEALITIQAAVFAAGRLRRGETLLLHGGSGGVGTIGLQMARVAGARVVVTAGSSERCARCEELGADRAVCYADQDFAQAVFDVSGGKGADVILDCVGAPYLARHLRVAAVGGRIVLIALMGGRRGELDLRTMLARRLTITASTVRSRPPEDKARLMKKVARRFSRRIAMGEIRPVVSHVLPLEAVAEAHRLMSRSEHFGKIILTPENP